MTTINKATEPFIGEWCGASIAKQHESWRCLVKVEDHGRFHYSEHFAGPPCEHCGSIDIHSETCPTPGVMEDPTLPLVPVVWADDLGLLTWRADA